MTGKGTITSAPNRRLKLALLALAAWLALLCALGGWWGKLVLVQGARIAELEHASGAAAANEEWLRTQRMLAWESATFFLLLLLCSGVQLWVYWRDLKRTQSLQAFFASLTHELRTPLTSIRLQAESLAERGSERGREPGREPGREEDPLILRLLEDTTRLEAQVERTLELARVEGGGPIFTQAVALKPWLERFLRAQAPLPHVEVSAELDADLAVEADPAALQVILRNLLENSIRHSRRSPVKVELQARTRGSEVELRVRDDGEGFRGDARRIGRLFEKGPGSQGAGVGLYLVDMLMSRMGGRASFAAGPGFEVVLSFREGRTGG
jgi:signal transduction histidine kinase